MELSVSVDIAAPPERVWAIMSDVERWHEWTASITSIQLLDTGPLAVGSKARVRQPQLLPAVWTVTAIEANRHFSWTTGGPGVLVTGRHSAEGIDGGTRATLSLRYEGLLGGLVGWLTRGLTDRYLNLEAAGLKRRSDST